MSTDTASFYVTGGTLRQDAPSYVERQADKDLYEGLTRGEFCYVLTSRQMGKSSLMVHTAARLRAEGVAVVVLDLTAIGQNLSAEQWYGGLLRRVGRQLDPSGELEEELDELWFAQEARVGPLERWMQALERVVLPGCSGRIVLFIDEIDAVRSLPFSTDEFFAAVRECYNRRSQDPAFERLTFCLLGVATPSDLIQDTRTTPFNIGTRIDLTDFTATEAAPLSEGLGRSESTGAALLARVLYWTDGHPYLTQRLCQAVAADEAVTDPAGVDRLCEGLFLSPQAQERDDNLLFVRERLSRSEADVAGLLDLYGQVRSGKPVRLDDTNQLVSLLRLSGITRVAGGCLLVRNRIYERVFDREWIAQHMPDAELRRQRAAYRRGLARATAVSVLIVAVIAGLALTAVWQAQKAEEGQRNLRRHLYAAQMSVAQQAWNDGNIDQVITLLNAQRPRPGQEDLRGFEWRYLWRLCRDNKALFTFRGGAVDFSGLRYSPGGKILASRSGEEKSIRLWDVTARRAVAVPSWFTGRVESTAFSRDGRILAVCAGKPGHRIVRLWDVGARRELPPLQGHTGWINRVVFSPDGRTLATASSDRTVRLWDLPSRQAIATLSGHKDAVGSLAFSPDGKILASGSDDKTIRLWKIPGGHLKAVLPAGDNWELVFSADGRTLASPSADHSIALWDAATGRRLASLKGHQDWVQKIAFSPDGKLLASASDDNTLKLWDVTTRREAATLRGHRSCVLSLAFSPDGKELASVSDDLTARLWDVTTGQELAIFRGHRAQVCAVAFSPDGQILATGSADRTVKLWDATVRDTNLLQGHHAGIRAVYFSPDGRTLVSASPYDGTVKLWDLARLGPGGRPRQLATLKAPQTEFHPLAFSPDGQTLALCGIDKSVKLWDLASRRTIRSLSSHGAPPGSVVFSPDGKLLAFGSGQWRDPGVVRLWEIAAPAPEGARHARELAPLRGHTMMVKAVAFSPDGKLLATGSLDRTARLWDLATRRQLTVLRGHTGTINEVAFSPDSKTLATGGDDHTVKLWDVATRRERVTLQGYPAIVDALAFSRDGKTLAIGGASNAVTLWNVATQQPVATLAGHQAPILSASFSPDGSTLATGSFDATVRLWRAARFAETDAASGAPTHRASPRGDE